VLRLSSKKPAQPILSRKKPPAAKSIVSDIVVSSG
jgi:hypothetical protein